MKPWMVFLEIFFLGVVSCATGEPATGMVPDAALIAQVEKILETVQVEPEPAQLASVVLPEVLEIPEEAVFDPSSISQEEFETTKADIQQLVQNLNRIIRSGNFTSWLSYLADSYRARISSRDFLNDLIDKYPVYRGRINSARDYFNYVVVPSRANDHVDDIEFVSKNEVKAYSEDAKGQTVVLYSLENLDGRWKISN
jgi:hypothetical protein